MGPNLILLTQWCLLNWASSRNASSRLAFFRRPDEIILGWCLFSSLHWLACSHDLVSCSEWRQSAKWRNVCLFLVKNSSRIYKRTTYNNGGDRKFNQNSKMEGYCLSFINLIKMSIQYKLQDGEWLPSSLHTFSIIGRWPSNDPNVHHWKLPTKVKNKEERNYHAYKVQSSVSVSITWRRPKAGEPICTPLTIPPYPTLILWHRSKMESHNAVLPWK